MLLYVYDGHPTLTEIAYVYSVGRTTDTHGLISEPYIIMF